MTTKVEITNCDSAKSVRVTKAVPVLEDPKGKKAKKSDADESLAEQATNEHVLAPGDRFAFYLHDGATLAISEGE